MAALTKVAPPDLAVIACNTASTLVLEPLRARFDFPFVGCVPPVKPAGAAQARDGKAIGLLATPATVERPYTDNLIRAFAGDSPVIRIGAPGLARLAEAALRGRPLPPDAIREELAAFFDGAGQCLVDRVVLGCTHYPFLLPELAAALPADVLWLDSGEAIARRVRQLLAAVPERQATALPDMADSAVFTQGAADNAELAPLLRQLGFRQYGVMAFPRGADKAEAPARFVVL
jgi:glutamate racemase